MKVLVGGVIAAVVGLIGLVIWWGPFLEILQGGIPVILLLGGALAIYVGFDEMKDQMTAKEAEPVAPNTAELDAAKEDLKKAQAEAEKYKAELEKVKTANKAKK